MFFHRSIRRWLPAVPAFLLMTSAEQLHGVEYVPFESLPDADVDESEGEPDDARVEDLRVEPDMGAGPNLTPRDDQAEIREEGWDLGISLEAAYDDNIFLSANNAEEDLLVRVTPRVAYALGRENEPGGYIRFAYLPSGVVYLENGDETRVDHDAKLDAAWTGKRSEVGFTGRLRRLGDATPDTGSASDRTEYESELRYAWKPREKIAVEVAAATAGEHYDDRRLADAERVEGAVALRYAYSPKTEISAEWRTGREQVDGGGDQDYNRVTARLAWQPREKWTIDVEAGVEHRDYPLGSELFPVFDARADWRMREGTEWFVTAYRREDTSATFAGQNIELLGIAGGVSQKLGRRWTATLEAGFERADYKNVAATGGPAGRQDDILYIRPSLDYDLNDDLRLGLFYQYSENQSNSPGFGYTGNRIGIDVAYDF